MIDVAVLGSLNMDVVIRVADFPRPGETIMSRSVQNMTGGKGANQAIAAAKMGGQVAMIGALGGDDNGRALRKVLDGCGVDTSAVATLNDATSGVAQVIVADSGENMIMVLSGANGAVTPEQVRAEAPRARVYLAQLETPVDAVEAFFIAAREQGGLSILNTAPALPQAAALFHLADLIVLNESELESYAKTSIADGDVEQIAAVGERLISRDDQRLIVTCGAKGAVAVGRGWREAVAGQAVQVIDTTGAGDCFCGVLAAGLGEGLDIGEAMRRANAAAALSVGRTGAGQSAPTKAEVEDFLHTRRP